MSIETARAWAARNCTCGGTNLSAAKCGPCYMLPWLDNPGTGISEEDWAARVAARQQRSRRIEEEKEARRVIERERMRTQTVRAYSELDMTKDKHLFRYSCAACAIPPCATCPDAAGVN